jgi:hypothetical protein
MVACPKCNGELSLPEDGDPHSIVYCPHCHDRYPLLKVLVSKERDDDDPLLFSLDAGDEDDDRDDDLELDLGPLDLDEPAGDALETVGVEHDEPIDFDLRVQSEETNIGAGIESSPPVDDIDELDLKFFDEEDEDLDVEMFADAESEVHLEQELQAVRDDFEMELDEPPNEPAVEIDGFSAATESALRADNQDLQGVDDVSEQFVSEAIKTEPGVRAPVEVVKPFHLAPPPHQVPAKNFKPGIPRSGRRMVSSLLKFGIGGLLGLLLCQAGLWWIGHLDPLGLAAILPKPMGFLAPESVRTPHRPLVANRPPSLGTDPALIEALPEPTGSEDVGIVDASDEALGDEGATGVDENRASAFPATTEDLAAPPQPIDITNDVVAVDSSKSVTASAPPVDVGPTSLLGSDDDLFDSEPAAIAPTIGLVGKEHLHRDDLSTALGESNRALDALLAAVAARASRETKQARMFEFYDSILKMAETAIHVDDDAAPVVSQMKTFVQGVSKYANVLGQTAARQLPDSLQRGVFLAGTVTEQSPLNAGYQRIQITLLGDRPENYQVIAPSATKTTVGDRVFVLGVHVADPDLEISGLASTIDGQAVWSDQIIPLP